jgi:uncharacterized Fe-S cluster protein YjdI
MNNEKEYTNGEISVIWKPNVCIHSGNCVRGLGKVFNPKDRPWIKMYSASTDEIINTVNTCPSGALTYKRSNKIMEKPVAAKPANQDNAKTKIQIISGGPIMVEGSCAIVDKEGNETPKEGKIFLCRCGGSKNKPFCDGTHKTVEFDK